MISFSLPQRLPSPLILIAVVLLGIGHTPFSFIIPLGRIVFMSGFEVLGVVLGTIPLVISALEHYQQGLHTIRRWHSYEAELQSLKRRLGIEKAIFVNTCEQLLSGIVCSVDHEKLIEEPFGELWAKPEIIDQVVLRLDHVFEPFRETLVAMNTALGEIKAKLGLDEQGEVSTRLDIRIPRGSGINIILRSPDSKLESSNAPPNPYINFDSLI